MAKPAGKPRGLGRRRAIRRRGQTGSRQRIDQLEKQADRLRHELEQERREHRDTLNLLSVVTEARNNAEKRVEELSYRTLATDHTGEVRP